MVNQAPLEQLINWVNAFDSSPLQNEDEVETKFVLPFFRYLGYSDEYRHGKYPVSDYQRGSKRGRKPEIDQIYFSVSEPNKQSTDTALVLVEAKEPQEHDLADAINQAKFYGNYLKPLFLVATNGHHLVILKRHQHRSEEVVFDITIDKLRRRDIAESVYNQLQFETVKRLKEQAIDPLTHAQYVEVMQAINRYPDIRDLLAKGDFEPLTKQEGRQLTVVKPKVAITCELPVAFEGGSCRIEFSNIMLQGLTCHLSHSEILTELFIGLGTLPGWETRSFIHATEQGTFEVHLGETTVILSQNEANDLCDAVDEVCQKYKEILVEATNVLETWEFRPVSMEDIKGFELLSVVQWLWDLMKQFSREFDYANGNSDWHIFDSHHAWSIRVTRKGKPEQDHVVIRPKIGNSFFPSNKEVDLLYVDCITYLQLYRDKPYGSIYKDVGPLGIWTATYTKEWIEQQFIPKVLSYYSVSRSSTRIGKIKRMATKMFPFLNPGQKRLDAIMREAITDYVTERVPLADISEPKQFETYLHEIQSLFHHYNGYGTHYVPALLLRPYYAAFTELARCTDPTTVDMHYIRENLGAVSVRTEQENRTDSLPRLSTYDHILNFLDRQVARIKMANYESSDVADYLSCAFIGIVVDGTSYFQQNQLNAAKEALAPLWEEYRFSYHFIDSIIYPG